MSRERERQREVQRMLTAFVWLTLAGVTVISMLAHALGVPLGPGH